MTICKIPNISFQTDVYLFLNVLYLSPLQVNPVLQLSNSLHASKDMLR